MANHKHATKAYRRSLKRAAINRNRVSRIRTYIKKAEAAIEAKAPDMEEIVRQAQKEIAKGINKDVIHKNTAARRISRLVTMMKAAS
jgi:small subunit ribosomal protein S20